MGKNIEIRNLTERDCEIISKSFSTQGWNKPTSQYQDYLAESKQGKRVVLVAEKDSTFAGYITIIWESYNESFRLSNIPEIVDLNVLKKYQRQGIGQLLLNEAEKIISTRSKIAGIGFGITPDYGPAHILYIKSGYIPNGQGICRNGLSIKYGDTIRVDDTLAIYLIKKLN